jgi:hypothetical protein
MSNTHVPKLLSNSVADMTYRDSRIHRTWGDPHRGHYVTDLFQELRSTEGVAGIEHIGSGELWFRFETTHCTDPERTALQIKLFEILESHLEDPDKYWVTH